MIHYIIISTDVLGNWERRDRLKRFLIVTPGWMELNSIVWSHPRCLKLLFMLDHSQCSKLQPIQWNPPPHRRGELSKLSNPKRSQWLLQCSWESVQGRGNRGRANTGTTMPNCYCPSLSSVHRTTRWTWCHLHSAGLVASRDTWYCVCLSPGVQQCLLITTTSASKNLWYFPIQLIRSLLVAWLSLGHSHLKRCHVSQRKKG